LQPRKSTLRGFAAPATFRLQGLATLLTAYAFRSLAGFVSRRQRSWDSPFGAFSSRKVSVAFPRGSTHVPFLPSVIPPPKRRAGPTSRGFWVLTLSRVPGDRTGFNSPTAGCSLGLHPPRASRREPGPNFCPGSSRTLLRSDREDRTAGVSEYRSALAWLSPPSRQAEKPGRATLTGFPHRYEPGHASVSLSGLCVHLAPRRTSLPTAGAPKTATALPELSGRRLRCRTSAFCYCGIRLIGLPAPSGRFLISELLPFPLSGQPFHRFHNA
jgi:hypothetical protein